MKSAITCSSCCARSRAPGRRSRRRAGQQLAAQQRADIDERPLAGGLTRALELIGASMDAALETRAPVTSPMSWRGLYAAALADLISDVGKPLHRLLDGRPRLGAARARRARLAGQRVRLRPASARAADQRLVDGQLHRAGHRPPPSLRRHRRLLARAGLHLDTGTPQHRQALRMAGIPAANLRSVAVDDLFRMDVDDLRARIEADRHRGCDRLRDRGRGHDQHRRHRSADGRSPRCVAPKISGCTSTGRTAAASCSRPAAAHACAESPRPTRCASTRTSHVLAVWNRVPMIRDGLGSQPRTWARPTICVTSRRARLRALRTSDPSSAARIVDCVCGCR